MAIEQFSTASGELSWIALVVLVVLAVGVVLFMLNPQIKQATDEWMCKSYYNILHSLGGPRPPLELCSSGNKPAATTTTGPLLPR